MQIQSDTHEQIIHAGQAHNSEIASAARLFVRLDYELTRGADVFHQRDEAKKALAKLCGVEQD